MKRLYAILTACCITTISCKMYFNVKAKPQSDEKIIEYTKKTFTSFDEVYRLNSFEYLSKMAKFGIHGINFVSLYDQNSLLKTSSGDQCEFRILEFIKDSLEKNQFLNTSLHNFSLDSIKELTRSIYARSPDKRTSQYYILVGYAIWAGKVPGIKDRFFQLEKNLKAIKNKYAIIALNLDPS